MLLSLQSALLIIFRTGCGTGLHAQDPAASCRGTMPCTTQPSSSTSKVSPLRLCFFLYLWTSVNLKGMTVGRQQSLCYQIKKKWKEKSVQAGSPNIPEDLGRKQLHPMLLKLKWWQWQCSAFLNTANIFLGSIWRLQSILRIAEGAGVYLRKVVVTCNIQRQLLVSIFTFWSNSHYCSFSPIYFFGELSLLTQELLLFISVWV